VERLFLETFKVKDGWLLGESRPSISGKLYKGSGLDLYAWRYNIYVMEVILTAVTQSI